MEPHAIKALRASMRLNQNQLAQLLGVHGLTVSKWERGKTSPSPWVTALLGDFHIAMVRQPELEIATPLAQHGAPAALFRVLEAAHAEHPGLIDE